MDDEGDARDRTQGARSRLPAARKGRPAAKPPASRKNAGASRPTNTAPPRKWWEQPWLWFVTIVVTVAAALSVSFVVNTDPQDIAPVSDTTEFCAAVRTYRDSTGSLSLSTSAPISELQRLSSEFGPVQRAAPPEIRPTVDQVANTISEVVRRLEVIKARGNGLSDLEEAEKLLHEVEVRDQLSTDRYANYVKRACGIDLGVPVETTVGTGSSVPTPSAPFQTAPVVSPPSSESPASAPDKSDTSAPQATPPLGPT